MPTAVAPLPRATADGGSPDLVGLPSHVPGLDGVRALAIVAVLAFHGGLVRAGGGFLGVDVFFVLSGFLITSLLLDEQRRTSTLRLGAFWARRARRLLPGLAIMVVAVLAWVHFIVTPGTFSHLRADALASLAYVANWHLVFVHDNYFAAAGQSSPFVPTWSLAIEEQFYLLWPIVLFLLGRFTRSLKPVLAVAALGAVASAAWMAVRYAEGASIARLYYGTDTHAQGILIGAALATAWTMAAQRRGGFTPGASARRAAPTVAGLALVVLLVEVVVVNPNSSAVFTGSILLASLATAALLWAILSAPEALSTRVLEWRPVVFLGLISYELYLVHVPIFMVLNHGATGLSGLALFTVRVAVAVGLAAVLAFVIDRPARLGRIFRAPLAYLTAPAAVAATFAATFVLTSWPNAGPFPTADLAQPKPGAPTVLVVGDSVAQTLGFGLLMHTGKDNLHIVIGALDGCGVMAVDHWIIQGQVSVPPKACQRGVPAARKWPSSWRHLVATTHPAATIILAGRWEIANASIDGATTSIEHPRYRAALRATLTRAVSIAGAGGSQVLLATMPCLAVQEQPNGNPWPESTAARVDRYNDVVRQVVAHSGGRATLLDLHGLTCPTGHFQLAVDGTVVRAPDGIHFVHFTFTNPYQPDPNTIVQADQFATWLDHHVVPSIDAAIARAEAARSRPS